MATAIDTAAALLEQVKPDLTTIFETTGQIGDLFKSNTTVVKNINRYLYRFDLQHYRGGTYGKYSPNEGVLLKGSGMKISSLQAGYFYSLLAYRVTDEQIDSSQNTKSSIIDVMAKTLADAVVEAETYDDIGVHGDGTAKLTNSGVASSTTTLTFSTDPTVDSLGVSKLREGIAVDVWDSAGAVKRAAATAAPVKIEMIDYSTNTVTFDQIVTGIQDTDIIVLYNMDVYGPATLTSGSAGWPATSALTNSGGLTNDTFRHGIPYAHDSNTASYYLGRLKSAMPQMVATQIDAQNQPLTFDHGFLGLERIRKRRNPDAAKGLKGIFPMAQRKQVFDIGVSIATKPLTGETFGKSMDLLPTNSQYGDTFNYCDMECRVSKRQPVNRIDFVNFKNWARAEVFPGNRPYEKDGRTMFPGRSSGGLVAAYSEFFFQSAYDYVCFDPGSEFYVVNAAVPDGFTN